MNPIEILEGALAELQKKLSAAKTEEEYARQAFFATSEKAEKLESSVRALNRAIEVLKNQ